MDTLIAIAAVLVAGVVIVAVVRAVIDVSVVHDYERGLRYRNGRLTGTVTAGTHLAIRPFSELRVLDTRPTIVPVEGQEILTSDGVSLKISLAARYVVGDVVAAVTRDADYRRALYLLLQLALRDVVTRRTGEEVLEARRALGPEVREACAGRLAELGIELLEVEVRDVMLPAELKRAYAGTVAARKEGQTAMERARGETAALRSLANTGHMLDENPGLLQLRILQQLGESPGSTVVYGTPAPGIVPRPGPAAGSGSSLASGPAAGPARGRRRPGTDDNG